MAKTLVRHEANYDTKVPDLNSEQYSEIILELIRCDIPTLIVGASSIGKSYSITEFVKANVVGHSFLFIGSEKSEYIEGIPEIRLAKEGEKDKRTKFSYMQPFWFPDALKTRQSLKRGMESFNKGFNNADLSFYERLVNYKGKKAAELLKADGDAEKKIIKDELGYISMLQGYGNFWLILDEVDKVEEYDRDKFAPLLHIVREKNLKGWTMAGIAENNAIKGVATLPERKVIVDYAINLKDANGNTIYKKHEDGSLEEVTDPSYDNITDTRVIAIANRSAQITEEALVRRFVHFQVDKPLYTGLAEKTIEEYRALTSSEKTAYNNQVEKNKVHNCIVQKDFPGQKGVTILHKMATLKDRQPMMAAKLKEINLAWTLGFIPDLLFPFYKHEGTPAMIKNLFLTDFWERADGAGNQTQGYLGKILVDNFDLKLAAMLMDCIQDQFATKESSTDIAEDRAGMLLDPLGEKYADPNLKTLDSIINNYFKSGLAYAEDYTKAKAEQLIPLAERVAESKAKVGKTDQKKATLSIESEMMFWAESGFKAIRKTIVGKSPTTTTRILMSSFPSIMKQVIGGHRGTSLDLWNRFQTLETKEMKLIIQESTTEKIPADDDKQDRYLEEAGKKFATALGAISQEHIYHYGYGVESEADMKTLQDLYMKEPSPENLKVIKGIVAKIDKAVIIEPTLKRWVEDLGDVWPQYTNKLVTYIVIQKEVAASIPALLNILVDDPQIAAAVKGDNYSSAGVTAAIDDYFQTIKDVVQTTPNKFKEYVAEGKYFKDKFKAHILKLVDYHASLAPEKQAEFDKK